MKSSVFRPETNPDVTEPGEARKSIGGRARHRRSINLRGRNMVIRTEQAGKDRRGRIKPGADHERGLEVVIRTPVTASGVHRDPVRTGAIREVAAVERYRLLGRRIRARYRVMRVQRAARRQWSACAIYTGIE